MKYIFQLVLASLLVSCELFVSNDQKTQELVNQEMLQINWNDVDSYPLFDNCDETVSKTDQRDCFEREFLTHCSSAFKAIEFTTLSDADSVVHVDFLVDHEGKVSVLEIQKDSNITIQMPNFDSLISETLQNLPPMAPALKRGVPVKTKFRMPIVLGGTLTN